MAMRVLVLLLPVLAMGQSLRADDAECAEPAAAPSPADALIDRAIEAQGGWTRDRIADLYLTFEGQIAEEGRTNSIAREYWYRARDRAFRQRTSPLAAVSRKTEHGVLGRRYWDRTEGRLQELSRGNRDHEEMIKAIRDDRDDFERILSMLLLSRLRDGKTEAVLEPGDPVSLEGERPPEVRAILGDASTRRYHVVDIRRPEEPPLRAFLDTEGLTVTKVEQYRTDAPGELAFVYYFGAYKRAAATGLLLPQYFSVHTAVPVDEKTCDATLRAKGMLSFDFNSDLPDAVFAPEQ